MEHTSADRLPAVPRGLVTPARDRGWPFPPGRALRRAHPALDTAAQAVLEATARAWGLAGRAARAPQAG